MKRKSEESDVKDPDPPDANRRTYLATVGALVAGLAVGGAAAWLAKPAEQVPGPTTTVTAPGPTVTAPGPTVTVTAPAVDEFVQLRSELAQKYANATPGEKFLVGYVTWTLAQEAPKYDFQASDQAARQLGLDFKGIEIGTEALKAVEATDSLVAAGAKGISYWAPAITAMQEVVRICEDNDVFVSTAWCLDPTLLPGDKGPRWFLEFSTMADEMSFHDMSLLFAKMRKYGKTKVLHVQGSSTIAPSGNALVNQGIGIAWQNYPEMQLFGHYWGEFNYAGGRKAGEDALGVRSDYEALWGQNDDVAMGAESVFAERGIDIGKFAAARDAIVACVTRVSEGTWFVTSLTEFQYFGGRRVAAIYDAATGVSYPLRDEMVQSPWVTTILNMEDTAIKAENEELIRNSGLLWHPNFVVANAADLLDFLKVSETYPTKEYPYDFRLLSAGKCKELDLKYDRHAGNTLTANDYYFVPLIKRFKVTDDRTAGKNLEEYKKQFPVWMDKFLDFRYDTHSQLMSAIAAAKAAGERLDPIWGIPEAQ